MNPKWAEENLQTIRTLMERSALYRRALAPVMTLAGALGILGGLAAWRLHIDTDSGFLKLWGGVAVVALTGALLLVRRQALKDSEPFWSPPTRRVAQALLPGFFIGSALAVLALIAFKYSSPDEYDEVLPRVLVIIWTWFYGCSIHAAGFFMPRGVRWLGWIFIMAGMTLLVYMVLSTGHLRSVSPHCLMAATFGGLHLAYGIYLYFTEKKNPA